MAHPGHGGGLAVFAGLLASLVVGPPLTAAQGWGLAGAALLVLVGALDDRYRLGPRRRLLAQIGAGLLLTLGGGVVITRLGDLLGTGPLGLGDWGVPFTLVAVVGRRLSDGRHPFAADRGHLHHCLARLLHSTRRALIILLALALLLAGIGVAGQVLGVAEAVMFYLALACFGGYLAMLYRWPAWHRRRLKQERAAATLRCGGR